ncbi:Rho termination factor N-terminal domain-containing protein [Nonomuraea gerenzanensis]|uniref:1,4-alpha-glucan branching enzyme n=1 Tax=Nonomuraea gerenzanensis TaxID=93944 RepID=A0A1M4EBL8_9ACTN|nr:Rho termination factor N-terminal domain-containing protein [Nonomuraea gerenzanensis]UBU18366.1 Rho termination factor N-terminal domain-containing protein [Nonomuraea gerenzanensis]SBO96194.1 1,4-alpha-glucan branching enzyme [Nonomuraea gerenzanensis]
MAERKDRARNGDVPGNQTPNTPDVDESKLAKLKVDELRDRAQDLGVSGASQMRKEELIEAVAQAASRDGQRRRDGSGGDGGGGVRRGPDSSKSLKYSQEIRSPEEEPERAGRSLVTTNHEVIKRWAEEREAVPATVEGTEHGDHLGVLRLDFPGYGGDKLRQVSWDEWFGTFDERGLNFIYQERRSDGSPSNFFRLENPDREDA